MVLPVVGGYRQPMAAGYRTDLAPRVEKLIEAQRGCAPRTFSRRSTCASLTRPRCSLTPGWPVPTPSWTPCSTSTPPTTTARHVPDQRPRSSSLRRAGHQGRRPWAAAGPGRHHRCGRRAARAGLEPACPGRDQRRSDPRRRAGRRCKQATPCRSSPRTWADGAGPTCTTAFATTTPARPAATSATPWWSTSPTAHHDPGIRAGAPRLLGGAGLGVWLMTELAPPGVDPLDPAAPLAFVFRRWWAPR